VRPLSVPQSCILQVQIGLSNVLYIRSLLFVESFDFRPSNKYILVRAIPSFLRFANLCLWSAVVNCKMRELVIVL
jgi:hypothetical protein